jgi:hypothetical protein
MPEMSDLIEPGFDSTARQEADMLEAATTVKKTSDRMQWTVELAREWAVLGGD